MVRQRSPSIVNLSETRKNTKSYVINAFTCSIMVSPLNYNSLESSLAGPFFYLSVVSFLNIFGWWIKLIVNGEIDKNFLTKVFTAFSIWLISIGTLLYVISYLFSLIFEVEYDKKQFGLISSTVTYLPLLMLFHALNIYPILNVIVKMAYTYLTIYYIEASYQTGFEYPSRRKAMFFWVLSFAFAFLLEELSILIISYDYNYKLFN